MGLAASGLPALPNCAALANELVMFERQGCPFCQAWDRDVGRLYAETDEAALLPLRRVDIEAPRPTDLAGMSGLRYTPTFLVTHCGRELRRITGYPGEANFWGLLDEAVSAINAAPACEEAR
jgi:thioredoxin-related protein